MDGLPPFRGIAVDSLSFMLCVLCLNIPNRYQGMSIQISKLLAFSVPLLNIPLPQFPISGQSGQSVRQFLFQSPRNFSEIFTDSCGNLKIAVQAKYYRIVFLDGGILRLFTSGILNFCNCRRNLFFRVGCGFVPHVRTDDVPIPFRDDL